MIHLQELLSQRDHDYLEKSYSRVAYIFQFEEDLLKMYLMDFDYYKRLSTKYWQNVENILSLSIKGEDCLTPAFAFALVYL